MDIRMSERLGLMRRLIVGDGAEGAELPDDEEHLMTTNGYIAHILIHC